jgi:hypothetical protein
MTPFEMEIALRNIGYDQEYLESLETSRIKSLYKEEFE